MSQANESNGVLCERVDAHMAELLDGTAPEEVYDHLADCDRCRDARHDAEQAGELVAEAGIDFEVPPDLEARVLAAIGEADDDVADRVATAGLGELAEPSAGEPPVAGEDRPGATVPMASPPEIAADESEPSPEDAPAPEPASDLDETDEPDEPDELDELDESDESDESDDSVDSDSPASEVTDTARVEAAGAGQREPRERKVLSLVGRLRRSRSALVVGVVGLVAAAAAVGVVVLPGEEPEEGPAAVAVNPWKGTVKKISRAAGGDGGLELCNSAGASCRAVVANESIPAGAVLRTDDRTRAYVQLDDGTKLALDRSTELALQADAPRHAKLGAGAIVADVAHLEENKASIQLPNGRIEVLGTKFALRTSDDSSAVDVSRGAVRLVDQEDRGVTVRAGEEGRIYRGVAPYASGAPALGEALSWGEQDGDDEDVVARGLGELRAKKPGSDEEKKDAVELTSHHVKVRIVDGFARTEIDEVYTNKTNDVLEGIYRFPLPPDAQIERLALEVDGHFEEGAFVDRDEAAAIWRGAIVAGGGKQKAREEIVWVPGPWKDPALLEWQRGGRFELRIYPIPKLGSRRIILTYTQVIKATGGVRRYVYPLAHDPSGSSKVGDFSLDVQVQGHDDTIGVSSHGYALREATGADAASGVERLEMKASSFVPTGDLVLEYALPDRSSELTAWTYQPTSTDLAAGKDDAKKGKGSSKKVDTRTATATDGVGDESPYVALALRPQLPRSTEQLQRAYVIVVDASRSMYIERYKRATALAGRVIEELDRLDRFTVLACDTTCTRLAGGLQVPSRETADQTRAFLAGVTPEGGSDVAAALREAGAVGRESEGRALRVVYIGDGTPTVGPIRPGYVTRAVEAAMPSEQASVTAVAIGADADLDALGAVARGGGGVVLPYVPGQRLGHTAYAILGASYGTGLRDIELELPAGLVASAPSQLDTIPAGGEATVVARMTKPQINGTVVLRGKVGSQPFEQQYDVNLQATSSAGNAFVPRLYAAVRIADLEREGTSDARKRAVALSGDFNVASRYTSLLVLESPAMFRAFGLDNKRRAPEWTGEERTDRSVAAGKVALDGARDQHGEMADDFDFDFGGVSARAKAARKPVAAKAAPDFADEVFEAPADPWPGSQPAGPAATATMAPPPPPAPPVGGLANCPANDLACQMRMVERERPRRGGRRMIPMRRIWERQAHLFKNKLIPDQASLPKLVEAEKAFELNPNRREAVRTLYKLYMLSGRVDKAQKVALEWSDKEPLDPTALTARADLAAQSGDRDLAIRILGSVVDVRPGAVAAHRRLARLHRWAGNDALGCRHWLAISQLKHSDSKLLAEAVRCGRRTGERTMAEDMLAAADDKTRKAAERLLAKDEPGTDKLSGELRLEATWQGAGNDLDVALLHPDGMRVSWLGAPTKAIITARDVTSDRQEGLALRGSKAGDYIVEIVRATGQGDVRGTVKVKLPGAGGQRELPFELRAGQDRVSLGLVKVSWSSRLVPL